MADTGFQNPSQNGDDYTGYNNPTNAYTSDNIRASSGAPGAQHDWYGHDLSAASGTVDGIEVILEGRSQSGTVSMAVELSWDGGASYTSTGYSHDFTSTEEEHHFGGASDTWGRSWSISELTSANFRVRVTDGGGGAPTLIDWIPVKVYYTAGGGPSVVILRRRRS